MSQRGVAPLAIPPPIPNPLSEGNEWMARSLFVPNGRARVEIGSPHCLIMEHLACIMPKRIRANRHLYRRTTGREIGSRPGSCSRRLLAYKLDTDTDWTVVTKSDAP